MRTLGIPNIYTLPPLMAHSRPVCEAHLVAARDGMGQAEQQPGSQMFGRPGLNRLHMHQLHHVQYHAGSPVPALHPLPCPPVHIECGWQLIHIDPGALGTSPAAQSSASECVAICHMCTPAHASQCSAAFAACLGGSQAVSCIISQGPMPCPDPAGRLAGFALTHLYPSSTRSPGLPVAGSCDREQSAPQ